MAEVDVTFRFAGFVAKAMNLSGHSILHLSGWYMDVQRMVSRGAHARGGGPLLARFTSGVESVLTTATSQPLIHVTGEQSPRRRVPAAPSRRAPRQENISCQHRSPISSSLRISSTSAGRGNSRK